MTSAHTSLAAARAPARSPLAALWQMLSTLSFTLAESVGSLWMIDLHTATACATPAAVVGTLVGTLGVFVGDVGAVFVLLRVELLVFVAAALLGAGVELLWLLVVELLLPHPASNTPPMSATTSHVDACLTTCPVTLHQRTDPSARILHR